jgi:ribosomal RNA assembly protein
MTEYMYELKIPKERIAVLIGTKGEIKKQIEDATGTHIDVDSNEGDVFLKERIRCACITHGNNQGYRNGDLTLRWRCCCSSRSMRFELINLKDHGEENQLMRLKGRVIGGTASREGISSC